MPPELPNLSELRRRLDEIDDKLQDLLIERAEIVSAVAASKREGNLSAFQPGREAEIIRRLVDRHHGAFPVATLVRMWREMLAATVRLQSAFAVAVFSPLESQGFWDLARDHYGSHTPMSAYRSISQVIGAVIEGQASVGVLPMPQEAGRDRVLLVAEFSADMGRGRIFQTLSSLGMLCTFFASYEHAGSALNLIEIEGFVPITDPRLDRFRAQLGSELHRLLPFGGYAIPLSATALAKSGTGLAGCSAGAAKN